MIRTRFVLSAFSLLLVASVASAQATVSANVAVNSQYQWRGLTTTNRLVIQPDLGFALPVGTATIAAGVWASLDGGRYDGPNHISQNGGAGVDLTEYDVFVDASRAFGRVTYTVGAIAYTYPNSAGTTSVWNTYETYLKAKLDAPLAPSFAIWQDLKQTEGAYAEFGLSHSVGRFAIGGLAGWNIGQSVGDGGALGYFEKKGFTHADVSVSSTFELGAVSATPNVHLIVANDPFTKFTAPGETKSTRLWLGVTFSWSHEAGQATAP